MSNKKDRKKDGEEQDPDAPFVLSSDTLVKEIQQKAMLVFDVFDQAGQKSVDVREVGTMVRALDLCPTEADLHEIIGNVEEISNKGVVKLNTFVNHMTKVICDGKYSPIPIETLTQAFKIMDKEKNGTLEPVKVKDMLMREGEPFTAEEVDEMFNFAVDKSDNLIHWEDYLDKLYRNRRQ